MHEYKIRYRDGRTQKVTADLHGTYGEWIIFSLDRRDILRIAAKDIESVAEADVPDPEQRKLRTTAV